MRSLSVKSFSDWMFGFVVFIHSGMEFIAATPFTGFAVPAVRDQRRMKGGTPPAANCTAPDRIASFMAAPPASVT